MKYTIHQIKEKSDLLVKGMGDAIISTEEYYDEQLGENWVRITLTISSALDVINLINSGVTMGLELRYY
jgi:hypothetical protein